MEWIDFKGQLQQYAQLPLRFKYAADKWVNDAYHITEIKNAPITSVDCGGVMNRWTEVIVQLWVPSSPEAAPPMTAGKALSIIDLVEKILPLEAGALVKVEFGTDDFDTRQLIPQFITVEDDTLVIALTPDTVQCKAISRGGSCGTSTDECCTPEKPLIQLKTLSANNACCSPESGCC